MVKMKPYETFRRLAIAFTLLCWLIQPGLAAAQTPAKEKTQAPVTSSVPVAPPASPLSEQLAATPPQSEVLYGLQGVLVETLDGRTVATQSADVRFNPASAIKLATSLMALKTFGINHRFVTGVWTNGTFDKPTGTINGNLYISGRDPSFHFEHAVMIARQLNTLGIKTVSGDLVVAPGFTMNFNWSARRSGEQFYDTLDSTLRSAPATRAWTYERTAVGDTVSLQTVPSVAVMGEVRVETVGTEAKLLMAHKSSRLVDILKVLLCYSNNFMAERLGDTMGGTQSVENQVITSLGLPSNEFQISSLSGLGVNRVTPRAMMKIFRALRDELKKNKLTTADIMPVAGIDPGTLEDRFVEPSSRGSVIAKTGTLIRTDGGASALVGQLRTLSGETLLFVIMNQRGSVLRFRENQDFLVKQIQDSRGGPRPFAYKPHMLAMKLADTEHSFTSESEEFEPRAKVHPNP